MSCLGVLFALTDADAQTLRSLAQDDRIDFINETIEQRDFGGPWAGETDKAWDAIHRCFADGRLSLKAGDYPFNHIILGGEQLFDGDSYIISLKTPQQVRDIAAQIGSVTEADLRARYRRIDPARYGMELTETDESYTWEYFSGLVEFYTRAAHAGRWVAFTVDQ